MPHALMFIGFHVTAAITVSKAEHFFESKVQRMKSYYLLMNA